VLRVKAISSKSTQRAAMVFVWGAGAVTMLILLAIIGYVLVQGIPEIGWSFLTTKPEGGLSGDGGISTVIVSTIYLVGLTIAILLIPGIGAGIYLAEYAPDNRLTHMIRYGIETLAGIPSIVFGLFGFALFVTALHFRFSLLSGALTLVCLLLPTLIRTTEEAIKAVPRGHREGSLALGATKWQTIRHVVLPAALPGIVTGVILCVGRAIGTLSLHLFYLAMETNAFEKAMATGAVLILTIIIINTITNWLSYRYQVKMRGRLS